MTKERTIKLFPKQYEAFNFSTQFGCIIAGVQSGKTFTGSLWAGKKMQEYPKGVGVIIAPTYKILQQATMKKFFDIYPQLRKYYKEQKGEIQLPTGGVVFIRSADSPLGIEGITANWIWMDEGGMTSLLAWTVCRSRVSLTGGQILITTTPYNMGWLYTDFYLRWKDGLDKNLSLFSWKSIENPYFNKEFYDAEMSRLRSEEFARRYQGEFMKMTGLVYDIPAEQIIDPVDIMVKAQARLIGVDWGWENPASIIVMYLHDKTWYVVDEWKQSHRTTAEIIQVLKNKVTEHRATVIYPDPAEPDRIEECRRANLSIMEANKDIKGGISQIQQLIREKRFYVFNNCQEMIAESSMYHYPESEEGKASKDLPEKFNDHLMDAMRYVIHSYKLPADVNVKQSAPVLPYYSDRDIAF